MQASPIEVPQTTDREPVVLTPAEFTTLGSVPVNGEMSPADVAFMQSMVDRGITPGGQGEAIPIRVQDPETGEPGETRQMVTDPNDFGTLVSKKEEARRAEQGKKGFELNAAEQQQFEHGIDGLGDSLRDGSSSEEDIQHADEMLQDNLDELSKPEVSRASRILGAARNIGAAIGPHVAAAAYNMLERHIDPAIKKDVAQVIEALSGGQREMTANAVRASVQQVVRAYSQKGKGEQVKQIALATAYGASFKTRDPELRAFALSELLASFAPVSKE